MSKVKQPTSKALNDVMVNFMLCAGLLDILDLLAIKHGV
jgi:hypothetical protein